MIVDGLVLYHKLIVFFIAACVGCIESHGAML